MDHFLGLMPRHWLPNRLYRVQAVRRTLCFAHLDSSVPPATVDQMTERTSADWPAAPFLWWLRRRIRGVEPMEKRIAATDPLSPEFLALHRHNFRIESRELARIVFLERPDVGAKMWVGSETAGRLDIHLATGKRVRLFLTGRPDTGAIKTLLRPLAPHFEVRT